MIVALYAALLIWQLVWLVGAVRKHGGWIRTLILNLVSTLLAVGLMWYFDSLPGFGMMPGLTYFAEVIWSLVASVVFAVLTLICLLGALFHLKK